MDYQYRQKLFFELGAERNFIKKKPLNEFRFHKMDLFDSVLAGLKYKQPISKKYSFTISLLYDFMYSQHSPITSPLVYRLGWEL